MFIATLEYIHKYMISLYENDFFSKGKMQIHVGATLPPPPPTGRRFRFAHGDHRFSLKLFQIAAEAQTTTRFEGLALPVRCYYASTTLPLRFCYDPTTTMKIRLRLVYADGDTAATLLRPRRWSYAFVAL